MKEILDEDFNKNEELDKDELTSNISLRTFIYLIFMLVGGAIFHAAFVNSELPIIALVYTSVGFMILCTVLSLILEVFRDFSRKRKEAKTGKFTKQDPLWFKTIEGGFSIWILLMSLNILGQVFN